MDSVPGETPKGEARGAWDKPSTPRSCLWHWAGSRPLPETVVSGANSILKGSLWADRALVGERPPPYQPNLPPPRTRPLGWVGGEQWFSFSEATQCLFVETEEKGLAG